MSLWNEEKIRNQGVLGDAFEDENTGKDAYANARNKVALMDKSYLPVSAAQAELRLLSGFMVKTKIAIPIGKKTACCLVVLMAFAWGL